MTHELFTIGHSNHPLRRFLELLAVYDIQLVCDVRSTPYSRFNRQFNREPLQTALETHTGLHTDDGNASGGMGIGRHGSNVPR